jgi:hypothetical protein
MVRRLLFLPILRTRSARKIVVSRSVIVLLSAAITSGCDQREPSPEPQPPVPSRERESRSAERRELEREFAELEAEAGAETREDPPGPSGNLRNDIESFTTLDACVRARIIADPLLGDAVDALGYDSLTRDACRILQALKAKRTDACKPIVASALRARCESYVAVLTGDPNLCPAVNGGGGFVAREAVCLARARRDERLCNGANAMDRPKCRALVLGQPGECGRDASCIRQVQRYRSLLEKPASHPALNAHLRIEIVEEGPADSGVKSLDMEEIAAGGAIVMVTNEKVRVAIGAPKGVSWLDADSPLASPKAFIEFSVPLVLAEEHVGSEKKVSNGRSAVELGPRDLRVDLLLPKVALLSASMSSDRTLDIEKLSTEQGGPIRFALGATLRDTPRVFRVKFDVETFVREEIGRAGGAGGPDAVRRR